MGLELPAHGGPANRTSKGAVRTRASRAAKAAALLPVVLFLSSCAQDSDSELLRLALPVGITDRTEAMYELWLGAWIAVLVTFLLVFGLILWAMVRYRRRSVDEVPVQIRYHLPLEVLYTVAPVIVVAVMFFHTVEVQNQFTEKEENPDHTITVVGQKWAWAFDYMGEDAVGGQDVFDIGTTEDFAELYLPVDESVRFNLHSPDVIHSFWIPEFYFKLDVVPGRDNSFEVTPTREGTYRGRCAELCGTYHSRMLFDVHVVSRAEYDDHLRDLEAAGNIGAPTGAEFADSVKGLESETGGTE